MQKKRKMSSNAQGSAPVDKEIDSSTSIGKLILGLAEEIKASEKKSSKLVLKDGEFNSQIGDLFIYDFALVDELPFQPEANLTISIGRRTGIRGYIHSLCKNTISIASEENVGNALDQITITNSDSASLQRLKDILFDLSNNPEAIPFSCKHASFTLGEGSPIAAPLATIPDDVMRCIQTLNAEQDKAVRVGMGSEFLLLWGPPGTGKTTTIATMLASLANSGESVLLVSNTNKAVEGALEKIIPNLEKLGIEGDGYCLRIGNTTKDFLKKFGTKSDLKTVAEERNQELVIEQKNLNQRRTGHALRLSAVRGDLKEYEVFEDTQRDLAESNVLANRLQDESTAIEHGIKVLVGNLSRLESEKVNAPETPGLFGMLGITRTKAEVETELLSVLERLAAQRSSLEGVKNSFELLQEKIADLKKAILASSAAISKLPAKTELELEVQNLDKELSDIDTRLAEIEHQIANTEQSLIDNAKIIGTTVYKTFLDPRLLKKQWDVVLVDEVSMLLLPMTYFVAGKATKRVILVGDFLQLPPIVASDLDNTHVGEWIKADPFKKWGVTNPKTRNKNPPDIFVALREQNRMHEQICTLISHSFYKDELVTSTHTKARKFDCPSIGKTQKRVLWIDTSGLNAWSSKRYGKGSLFNISHAALIGEIIDVLFSKGYFQGKNADGQLNSLGVVTPYAAQQELISTLLEPMKQYVPDNSVGTAHKFQGDEKDTIIVDLVVASPKLSRFINAESYDDDAGRLLNVGLSRAKEFLIVIVNKQVFERHGSRFMQQLCGQIEAAAERIDPTTLLKYSKHSETARDIAIGRQVAVEGKHILFTEQDFYPAITGDLASAQRSIVIFSAFMTTNGASRWLAVLSKALDQGATVQIVTKTLDKQPQSKGRNNGQGKRELSDLIHLIRRSGIAVDLRQESHEKIIVIDERVVWNGSLNMLSHVQNATREHMTRTDDATYGKEILKLMSRHDIRGAKNVSTEHPICPGCGAKSCLKLGISGKTILKCEDECGWAVPQEAFKKLSQGVPIGISVKLCPEPGCNGGLKLRYSAYGRYFLGCSCYRDGCRHKEDVHVNQFQYDPFPQDIGADLGVLSNFEWPKWAVTNNIELTLPVPRKKQIGEIVRQGITTRKQAEKYAENGKIDAAQDRPRRTPLGGRRHKSKKQSTQPKTPKSVNKNLDIINGLADRWL